MRKRTKTGQGRHDNALKRSANWYENQGYKVKVDLPGGSKPKKIGGHIPDLIAKKGKQEVIVEIETRESVSKDKDQQDAFKEYTSRKSTRSFRKRIVK